MNEENDLVLQPEDKPHLNEAMLDILFAFAYAVAETHPNPKALLRAFNNSMVATYPSPEALNTEPPAKRRAYLHGYDWSGFLVSALRKRENAETSD